MSEARHPHREYPSTYFVQNRSNEELTRLALQDNLLTAKMGGVLSEQPDPTVFRRVLDVGCGTGGWLIAAAEAYPNLSLLVGVDADSRVIEYARRQAEAHGVSDRVEFRTMDALLALDFPDSCFDLVNQRAALSFLRTWDWPHILGEYRRVARVDAVIRLTEADVVVETNSGALSELADLVVKASYQSGRLFTAEKSSVLQELPRLLSQQGFQNIQICDRIVEYCPGTEGFDLFVRDMQMLLRTARPFLSRWTHEPENYEDLCAEAFKDMQGADFVATWHYRTAWGINSPFSRQRLAFPA